jgi:hypothetical protein
MDAAYAQYANDLATFHCGERAVRASAHSRSSAGSTPAPATNESATERAARQRAEAADVCAQNAGFIAATEASVNFANMSLAYAREVREALVLRLGEDAADHAMDPMFRRLGSPGQAP